MKITREEAWQFILWQLGEEDLQCKLVGGEEGTPATKAQWAAGMRTHYGKMHLQELLDQIYGTDSEGNPTESLIK